MTRYIFLILGIAAMLCAGCAKQQTSTTAAPKEKNLPKWFLAPKAGCSAGVYEFKGSLQAARDGATERARRELSRNLEVKVKSLVKDYIEEGTAEGESFSEEQVTNVSKSVASTTMAGTRVMDGALEDDRYFSYVCLDTKAFADAFDAMSALSAKQRQALKKRAEREFQDLDKEIEALESSR